MLIPFSFFYYFFLAFGSPFARFCWLFLVLLLAGFFQSDSKVAVLKSLYFIYAVIFALQSRYLMLVEAFDATLYWFRQQISQQLSQYIINLHILDGNFTFSEDIIISNFFRTAVELFFQFF